MKLALTDVNLINGNGYLLMVFKIIGGLLLKLSIPLVLAAALFSFGMHSLGGDPAGMWRGFGSGVKTTMAGLFSNVKADASKMVDAVVGSARDMADGGLDADSRTQVFTWKDASGMTHYSNVAADAGAGVQKISVNADRNVIAPVDASKTLTVRQGSQSASRVGEAALNAASIPSSSRQTSSSTADKQHIDANRREVADLLGGQLPGVAGQKSTLPSVSDGGFSPAQLLKMLQQ